MPAIAHRIDPNRLKIIDAEYQQLFDKHTAIYERVKELVKERGQVEARIAHYRSDFITHHKRDLVQVEIERLEKQLPPLNQQIKACNAESEALQERLVAATALKNACEEFMGGIK